MSRIRDIANLFSANTDAATDAEVTAAISAHNTSANGHVKRGNTASRPASPSAGDVYANTETGFMEIYTGATYGWEQIGGISSTVTSVTATNQGTGRAFNNGQASIAFTPGTIAGRSYTATSSPGGFTATGSSSPLTVTGLQSNTGYTYTVTSTNNYGTSAASTASSSVTATTVPQAPTIGTATAASQSATLTFTEGATGGSSITNYKYSTDNSTYTAFDPVQTSSPLTISGLTDGTTYSFYLKAVNANGDSAASAASNSVVPVSGSFESIATVTVGSGGVSTISFTNIPQTFNHLQLRAMAKGSTSYGIPFPWLVINGGTNYTSHRIQSYGDSVTAGSSIGSSQLIMPRYVDSTTGFGTNHFGISITDILDYNVSNKIKVVRSLGGLNTNDTGVLMFISGTLNSSTNAITSLDYVLDTASGSWSQYSSFALYGIKDAS